MRKKHELYKTPFSHTIKPRNKMGDILYQKMIKTVDDASIILE